ncbi:rhamnogalacturonan acetylesterase [Neobacillus drentensis]|uniref:rhamnogalacturonan acetylesterase n=1 Tax=Neobacillus drentensis TaxID=220684 RepID=UPI001F38D304|nr:rhamnogalacturonan acetylesterase [Neobacillus drentensis]ULT58184.1 rhamnogalacturonan acetylesterase [Neobacillus drentensis]
MTINKITIFLAADSTVQSYDLDEKNQGGWGEFLQDYLTDDVQVINHAIGGRSSKTFVEEGRLHKIVEEMKEGDYLLIQMGHNDATANKPERYTDPSTNYKDYLKMYVEGARKCQAEPVFITPVARLHCEKDQFINDFPEYCQAMKEIAKEENVVLIDLMEKSLAAFETLGYEEVFTYFMASVNETDFTHFTKKGAKQMARLVAEGMGAAKLPISKFVNLLENQS